LHSLVLLKQADPSDAGCACFETLAGIFKRNPAKGENWDLVLASPAKGFKSCRAQFGQVLLLENRSKHGEVRAVFLGSEDISRRMTGDSYKRTGEPPVPTPDLSDHTGGDIVRAEMHSVGANRQSDVSPRVD